MVYEKCLLEKFGAIRYYAQNYAGIIGSSLAARQWCITLMDQSDIGVNKVMGITNCENNTWKFRAKDLKRDSNRVVMQRILSINTSALGIIKKCSI